MCLQIITGVPAQSAAFPAQPTPQSQLYTSVPANQGILPQQPAVFPGQPNFLGGNFVAQHPGVNVVRPMAGAGVQPVYRNAEPFAFQQPANQTRYLLPQPGPFLQQPDQPAVTPRLLPAGSRLPLDGNVVRTPMSSQSQLPGFMDFGIGEPSPLRFQADFASDPEVVGQPIETVIHDRKGPAWPVDGRAGFVQNKARPFLGAK